MPTTCICGNTRPVSAENELVCSRCGTVLGVEQYQEKSGVSKLNLFLQLEGGGRSVALPNRTKKKLHLSSTNSNDMGAISDICGKLEIKAAQQHDVFKVYKSVLGMKFSKAASACFAIYYTCRKDSVPFDEGEVRAAVTMAFGVQHAPTVLSVNFAVNKAANIPKNAWFAESVGRNMPTTTEANPPLFYLRRQLRRLCADNPDASYDDLYPYATRLFERVAAGNAEIRAKTAIRQTMLMVGIV